MKKLDKPVRLYVDKNGVTIRSGDTLRFDDGSIEKVYLAVGTEEEYDLGINASNEAYLELHPEKERELYPLWQFDHREYEVIEHGEES